MFGKALCSDREQFSGGRDVSVRIGDVGMANIRGQSQNMPVDIQALGVPALKPMADKRVTKIMNTGKRMVATTAPPEVESQ